MHWDFPEISLLGLGFGQKSGWEMGFGKNLVWEMGSIHPPLQDPVQSHPKMSWLAVPDKIHLMPSS